MGLLTYNGNNKIIKRICQLLNVKDVQDGEGHSLVGSDGIAVVTGGGGGSSTLAGLTDVDITGASGGDVLALNGSTSKWEDKTLSDVAISGSYDDLLNKPTIPSDFVHASTGGTFEGDVTIDKADGTTSTVGQSKLILGNSTGMGTDENSKGVVRLYSRGSKYVDICAPDGSAINDNYELNVPDKSGTIATISDIPSAVAVKGDNEQDYRTGNVNLTAENIGSVRSRAGVTITTLDALVELLTQSGGGRSFIATCNLSNIGVGVTGWQRIIAVSQNGANNGKYDLGMFCLFMPSDSSTNIKYALINGKTTGNYSVTATGSIPYSSNLATVATSGSYSDLSNQPTASSLGAVLNKGNADTGSMNAVAAFGNAMGMANLSGTDETVNPNAQTGWHHFVNISYTLSNSNMWQTQLACKAGTSEMFIRSRNGGSIVDGTAWPAPWVRLLTGIQRVKKSCNALPGKNGVYFEEYQSGTSYNLPSNAYYHIISMQGPDTNYGTQLALGMNTYGAFYRNYNNGSWGSWTSIVNSNNITGSAGSLKNGSLEYCYYANNAAILQGSLGGACWLTNTGSAWKTVFQTDGNLVIYQNSTARWSSGTSSRRFKHNIQDMTEERAKKILDIRPVTFDWNDDQPYTTGQNDNAGVIAEEVSQVCPDLVVFEDLEDGSQVERRVEYERFTPYLIKMVQMQQKEIEELKQRVAALEK